MGAARTIRNNIATIIAGVAVAALVVWSFAFFWGGGDDASAQEAEFVAIIHDGDGGVRELPLDTDTELTITTSLGTNTVHIESGAASIVEADCPKHECMAQRPISRPGEQLICLPHKLWVEIAASGSNGSEMDVDSVTWKDTDGIDVVSR